jgi:thiol-disulfide isomerase/thioredoxin
MSGRRRAAAALTAGVVAPLLIATAAPARVDGTVLRARATPLRVIWSRDSAWPRSVRVLAGRKVLRLADLRGHPFVLNFFASWCDACRGETSLLVSTARRGPGRVVFVGAAVDDGARAARLFLRAHGVPFPAVVAGADVVRDFRLIGLPDTFFVDGAGRVRMVTTGALSAKVLAKGLSRLGG